MIRQQGRGVTVFSQTLAIGALALLKGGELKAWGASTKSYPILLHSSPADTEHLTSKCYIPLMTRRSLPLQTRQDLIKLLFPSVEIYLLRDIKGGYSHR